MPTLLLADLGLFLGRFHPVLVHLPIGILLLAVLLEWWPGNRARSAIKISWLLGATTALAAAGCGWLLAAESGGGDTLFWHRWLGVSVAVLAVMGIWVNRKGGKLAKGYGLLVAGLLAAAGHQGGNLTHGEAYLFQHAPRAVQKIAGHVPEDRAAADWSQIDTDSINLFATFLQPAINETCVRCHNAEKQHGGLRMDTPQQLLAGGDDGPILLPGQPLASNWMKRLSLPRNHVKAMPPQGRGWDFAQIRLLEYWISEGADTLLMLRPATCPSEIKTLLRQNYGLDLRPKLFVEKMTAPALATQKIQELKDLNWAITELVPGGSALAVKPEPGQTITPASLQQLAALAPEQVAYLSVEELPLTDADLVPLRLFPNLNRLRLNGTKVSAATLAALKDLRHLESLNLYATPVNDSIFKHLEHFSTLKRLYLWQTEVTPEAVEKYASTHPDVEVNTGFTFSAASTNNTK